LRSAASRGSMLAAASCAYAAAVDTNTNSKESTSGRKEKPIVFRTGAIVSPRLFDSAEGPQNQQGKGDREEEHHLHATANRQRRCRERRADSAENLEMKESGLRPA
jgi:hypothetical protein